MKKLIYLLLFISVTTFAQKEAETSISFKECCGGGVPFECEQMEECPLDWVNLVNIPADIADGDQVDDADADPTNECNDNITINNTNLLTVTDDCGAKTVQLDQPEYCVGPFERVSSRTGWWITWTAVFTGNVARTETAWFPVGNSVVSPDCITDMTFVSDAGNHLIYSRRNRVYLWLDYRLVINGTPVLTRTYDKYLYKDRRQDTNPDVITPQLYDMEPMGVFVDGRLNVPAGATVQVEARQRYQVVGAQSSSYSRYIGGLRSQTEFNFSPRQIQTDEN